MNHVLSMHDLLSKDPSLQEHEDQQITMTTLVYHYLIDGQFNNLFQLLNQTKDLEFLAIKLLGYLQINRVDLAEKTYAKIKQIDEDSCLTTLCHVWVTLHDPKAPV